MNVEHATRYGSRRDVLVALRRELAAAMDRTRGSRVLVPLIRQLLDIQRELRALDAGRSGDD